MTKLNCLIACGIALFTVGCDQLNSISAMCKTEIKNGLINPESLEIFETKPSSIEDYREALRLNLIDDLGQQVSWEFRSEMEPLIQSKARSMSQEISELYREADFSKVRVKAEGKLGNKITSHMICAKLPSECSCIQEKS